MKKKVELHEGNFKIINLFQAQYPGVLEIEGGKLTLRIQDNQVVKIHNKDINAMGGIDEVVFGDHATLIMDPEDVRPLVGAEEAEAAE